MFWTLFTFEPGIEMLTLPVELTYPESMTLTVWLSIQLRLETLSGAAGLMPFPVTDTMFAVRLDLLTSFENVIVNDLGKFAALTAVPAASAVPVGESVSVVTRNLPPIAVPAMPVTAVPWYSKAPTSPGPVGKPGPEPWKLPRPGMSTQWLR